MIVELKKSCFIIMPFSETKNHNKSYWDNHFRYLKSLVDDSHPLIAHRSEAIRGDLVRQIITDLVTASVVIADLTDLNANVLWELGVRQSFRHCTITIAEEEQVKLPFDLASKGTLFYHPKDHITMSEFANKLHIAINDCLNNPDSSDSYVLETIAGRGTLFQVIMRQESLRKIEALLAENTSNSSLVERVIDTCNKNSILQKKGKAGSTIVSRLHTVAVENLIVNRYLEADSEFYNLTDKYFDNLISFNEVLSAWTLLEKKETKERWLLSKRDFVLNRNREFHEAVVEQKTRLLSAI